MEKHSPSYVFHMAHELIRRYDIGVMAFFAEDAVVEYPFAHGDMPKHLRGRQNIRDVLKPAYDAARSSRRRIVEYDNLRIHETLDPEVIVGEFELIGAGADESAYRLPFIQVLRIRDGEIVEMRDYYDSLAMAPHLEDAR